MITVEIGGVQYDGLIDVEFGYSLSSAARDFSVTIAQPTGTTLPFKGGEGITIRVDNEVRLEGIIFEVRPNYTKKSHTIQMTGRSLVANLIDSTLKPLSITADISLKKAIEQVVTQVGVNIKVINEIGLLQDFKETEDVLNAEPGDNAFDFIDRLARKRQVLLTSDPSGNIVITRNSAIRNPDITLFNPGNGTGGNILSAEISYNITDRFNKYIVMSQKNGAADYSAGALDPVAFVNQQGEQVDSAITPGRQMVIQSEKSMLESDAGKRATWQSNIARVRSRSYSVTVQGVRPKGGETWEINRLQKVVDMQCGIDEVMLVDSVRFRQSKAGGTITKLGLVDKNAYSLQLETTTGNSYAEFY